MSCAIVFLLEAICIIFQKLYIHQKIGNQIWAYCLMHLVIE